MINNEPAFGGEEKGRENVRDVLEVGRWLVFRSAVYNKALNLEHCLVG